MFAWRHFKYWGSFLITLLFFLICPTSCPANDLKSSLQFPNVLVRSQHFASHLKILLKHQNSFNVPIVTSLRLDCSFVLLIIKWCIEFRQVYLLQSETLSICENFRPRGRIKHWPKMIIYDWCHWKHLLETRIISYVPRSHLGQIPRS